MKTQITCSPSISVKSNRSIFTFLVSCCLLATVSGEISKNSIIEVKTTDGDKFYAAYQGYDPVGETIQFVAASGGVRVIACSKLTNETLGRSTLKMAILTNQLPDVATELCNNVVSAKSEKEEKNAVKAIYAAGVGRPSIKEKLALFQLYGVVSHLYSTERGLNKASDSLELAKNEARAFEAHELTWLRNNRINPLTGRDRTQEHLAYVERGIEKIFSEPLMTVQQAKSIFMIRLASVQAYVIHCENHKHPDLAKAVGEIRIKVLQRSIIGQEMEKAADSILFWLCSRTVIHHYADEEQAYFVGAFGKLFLDEQVDQAFEILFFDLPVEQRAIATGAIKGALIKLTEGRITPQEIASGSTSEALLKLLATQSPDLKAATEVVERIMPFVEEAARMSSK